MPTLVMSVAFVLTQLVCPTVLFQSGVEALNLLYVSLNTMSADWITWASMKDIAALRSVSICFVAAGSSCRKVFRTHIVTASRYPEEVV